MEEKINDGGKEENEEDVGYDEVDAEVDEEVVDKEEEEEEEKKKVKSWCKNKKCQEETKKVM